MMKKMSVRLTSSLLIAMLLCFCCVTEAKAEPVELSFWFYDWGAERNGLFQSVVDDFNASQDEWHVTLYHVANSEGNTPYDDKLIPAIAAETPPDIIHCGSIGGSVNAGLLMDITDLTADVDYDMYYSVAVDQGVYKGRRYGLPYDMTCTGILLYNMDMFAAAGLDPYSPPETLDELWEYAAMMFETNASGNYTKLGFHPYEMFISRMSSLQKMFSYELYDENGVPTPFDENLVAALDWVKSWADTYGYSNIMRHINTMSNPDQPFRQGTIGMIYAYSGQVSEMLEYDVPFEWGIANFPTYMEGETATYGGASCLGVPINAKHPEGSVAFIKYFTGPEAQTKIMSRFSSGLLYGCSPIPAVNEIYLDELSPAQQVFITDIYPNMTYTEHNATTNPELSAVYSSALSAAYNSLRRGEGVVRQKLEDVERAISSFQD